MWTSFSACAGTKNRPFGFLDSPPLFHKSGFKAPLGQAMEERPKQTLLWSLARCLQSAARIGKEDEKAMSLQEHAA
jgi:hypothetical protein